MEFPCQSMGKASHVKSKLLGLTWNPMSNEANTKQSVRGTVDMDDMETTVDMEFHFKIKPREVIGPGRPFDIRFRSFF